MKKQNFVDVAKWFVTIIGIKPDAPAFVDDGHWKFPIRVEIRNNLFMSGRPVIMLSENCGWDAEFFIFQKKA